MLDQCAPYYPDFTYSEYVEYQKNRKEICQRCNEYILDITKAMCITSYPPHEYLCEDCNRKVERENRRYEKGNGLQFNNKGNT